MTLSLSPPPVCASLFSPHIYLSELFQDGTHAPSHLLKLALFPVCYCLHLTFLLPLALSLFFCLFHSDCSLSVYSCLSLHIPFYVSMSRKYAWISFNSPSHFPIVPWRYFCHLPIFCNYLLLLCHLKANVSYSIIPPQVFPGILEAWREFLTVTLRVLANKD